MFLNKSYEQTWTVILMELSIDFLGINLLGWYNQSQFSYGYIEAESCHSFIQVMSYIVYHLVWFKAN